MFQYLYIGVESDFQYCVDQMSL